MGVQRKTLREEDIEFINKQKIFFIASCSGKEVNLSPKGYDSIKVIDKSRIVYLDYPGSGNRTARDIIVNGEITLMFTSFEDSANILKLFCKGRLVENNNPEFSSLFERFAGSNARIVRRLVVFDIYATETSCGLSVPYFKYSGERDGLKNYLVKADNDGKLNQFIEKYDTPPDLSKI